MDLRARPYLRILPTKPITNSRQARVPIYDAISGRTDTFRLAILRLRFLTIFRLRPPIIEGAKSRMPASLISSVQLVGAASNWRPKPGIFGVDFSNLAA
jgi:hypothetical protein